MPVEMLPWQSRKIFASNGTVCPALRRCAFVGGMTGRNVSMVCSVYEEVIVASNGGSTVNDMWLVRMCWEKEAEVQCYLILSTVLT